MYSTAIFEKLRQDTLSKKETFIGYMEIAEQMNKQIYMYMETSQNWILAKNNIYIYWQKVSMKKHRVKSLLGKMRKKERQEWRQTMLASAFTHSKKKHLFQKRSGWHLPSICAQRWGFSDWVDCPCAAVLHFIAPFVAETV